MKLPASYYNLISYIGVTVSSISIFMIIFMLILTSVVGETNAYIGIIIFLILPILLVIGLVLIPIGMWNRTRKAKKSPETLMERRLILNLNNKTHLNAAIIFIFGTLLFVLLTGVGSYQLYHYSESVEFCGKVCHEAMKPEYVAYQNSSHAKVTCAQCHIGSGAEWFVKAKISGMYQVYSVLANKVPRPIPTPIENLRPARETCEKCHWPEKFYENSLRSEKYFIADENNTEWDIHLEMKLGPKVSSMGLSEGIHWHINQNIKIEYAYTDKKREVIPWVKYINLETGDTIIYNDQNDLLGEGALDTLETRTMDCMDCHNRPAHNYLTPSKFMNAAIANGTVPKELPEIKQVSMGLLHAQYTNTDSALQTISNELSSYYLENYPEIIKEKPELLTKAIAGVIKGFNANIFPEMNVTWDAYPDHIGHMEFNGCFRCHNNTHESASGKIISRDCKLCHSIIAQGEADSLNVAYYNESLEFHHPIDIDGAWKEALCSECHRYLY
ncbi:MAG: NapC/NirT family cytochrome c [Salinivirgaceae bacterium]|nr:NapC/NirT family cytochrome c [Salinivirgaceae bacterium]